MSTTRTFRQHDVPPPHVESALYRQLLQEWVDLNALASSRAAVGRWGRLEPVLAGNGRPADIVDAIDAAAATGKDELLLALIRLFHSGHQLAGRVVLQTMLPKLVRLTLRTSPTSSDNAWTEDRHHICVAEFWDVLASYPLSQRTSKVASNLALDTLHRLSGAHRPGADIPIDPTEIDDSVRGDVGVYTFDDAAAAGSITVQADLVQVITWAVSQQTLTADEGTLLATCYLEEAGTFGAYGFDHAATKLGISAAAVRQRCSRATRKLTAAVQAELGTDVEYAA